MAQQDKLRAKRNATKTWSGHLRHQTISKETHKSLQFVAWQVIRYYKVMSQSNLTTAGENHQNESNWILLLEVKVLREEK